MSTQNLGQILAAILQHLVEGSAAFLVPGVDVGAVFDEKSDDLNHFPLALKVCRRQQRAAVMAAIGRLRRLETCQRAGARAKRVRFDAQALQQRDVQVAQGRVPHGVGHEVLAVAEASAGQQGR